MPLRNENIGVAVSLLVMVLGCWIAGWNPSDGEGAVIMTAAFLSGFATFIIPFERQRRRRSRQPGVDASVRER